jgi:hypothetical protein
MKRFVRIISTPQGSVKNNEPQMPVLSLPKGTQINTDEN